MNAPVTLKVNGSKLLKLAKGQYTALTMRSGSVVIQLNYRIVSGGSSTPSSTHSEILLPAHDTSYLVITLDESHVFGDPQFLLSSVPRGMALAASRDLTPMGGAVDRPLVASSQGDLSVLQRPGQPYESPLHNFSAVVPELLFGTKVQEDHNRDDGMVTFLGDAGEVQRIDYQRFPPDFPYPSDSAMLHSLGHVVLGDLLSENPGAILDEGPIQVDGQDAWFALVKVFHASRVADSAGRRLDATRALLVFARRGFLYTLHAQRGAVEAPPDADDARRMLTLFYGRITFH